MSVHVILTIDIGHIIGVITLSSSLEVVIKYELIGQCINKFGVRKDFSVSIGVLVCIKTVSDNNSKYS